MAGLARIDILSNASAGTSSAVAVQVPGWYLLYAEATWSGGNVQLQFQSPQGTWINKGNTITANGDQALQLSAGQYRVVVTTATAVFCSLLPIPTMTLR